jgi:acyl carrier protein
LAAVVAGPADLDPAELHRFAAQRLPDYMLPDPLTILDTLPLTPNGKINRTAIQHQLAGGSLPSAPSSPPEGDLEKALAEIWCESLDVPSVGRNDSFFTLGGDSLQATRLMERVRRQFGVEVPLRQLLAAPSIAALAAMIAQSQEALGEYEEGVL